MPFQLAGGIKERKNDEFRQRIKCQKKNQNQHAPHKDASFHGYFLLSSVQTEQHFFVEGDEIADAVANERKEQQQQEDDDDHRQQRHDGEQQRLAQRVVMRLHHAADDENTAPAQRQPLQNVVERAFLGGNDVCEENHRRLQDDVGRQRVAGGDVDILERALALKQRRQSPVARHEEQKRQEDGETLLDDVHARPVDVHEQERRELHGQQADKQHQKHDDVRRAKAAAFFAAQIPEAIEGVEDNVERIAQGGQQMLPLLLVG